MLRVPANTAYSRARQACSLATLSHTHVGRGWLHLQVQSPVLCRDCQPVTCTELGYLSLFVWVAEGPVQALSWCLPQFWKPCASKKVSGKICMWHVSKNTSKKSHCYCHQYVNKPAKVSPVVLAMETQSTQNKYPSCPQFAPCPSFKAISIKKFTQGSPKSLLYENSEIG